MLLKQTNIRHDLDLRTEVKEFPDRHFLYVRSIGPYLDLDYPGIFKRLHKYMFSHFLRPETHQPCSIFPNAPTTTPADKLITDTGFFIRRAVKPKGEIGCREIPGGRYLCALYKGPYPGLSDAYDTLFGKIIPEKGLRLRDEPSMECYLNNPQKEKPEDLLTEIQIPIE